MIRKTSKTRRLILEIRAGSDMASIAGLVKPNSKKEIKVAEAAALDAVVDRIPTYPAVGNWPHMIKA